MKRRFDILIHAKKIVGVPVGFNLHESIPHIRRVGFFNPRFHLLAQKIYVNTICKFSGGVMKVFNPRQAALIVLGMLPAGVNIQQKRSLAMGKGGVVFWNPALAPLPGVG